tara:strand:- start:100 stop:279 length:180 start_codon:yes stop_codon:yes gene_type:complete
LIVHVVGGTIFKSTKEASSSSVTFISISPSSSIPTDEVVVGATDEVMEVVVDTTEKVKR